ncbi:MAG TPA: glycosyltransferase family 25 protein [Rhizomicrobium sp.]|nr:glycosyltransferase family 25 protein [Rhizomicrobium sp.]
MRIHLVNLKRRPDRLAAMTAQLDRLGLSFERFDAVDARTADPAELGARFAASGPLGALSAGDMACTMSHLSLWRAIAAGTDSHAAILEDDILISDAAPNFLLGAEWIPRGVGLIKLERYGDANQLIVIGRRRIAALGRQIAPLLSRHTGSGGYIISRETAAALAGLKEKFTLPIDHLLFNPNNSPVFHWLKPWQLLPAIVDQRVEVGGATDIHLTRQSARPKGMALVRRQLVRNYYDVRLIPRQAAAVLSGRARLVKIRLA